MNKDTKKRAAIYVRRFDDRDSPASQARVCYAYAEKHGYEVCHYYFENHHGVELERSELSALRESIRNGDIDVVVVSSIDRLSRIIDHIGILMREAKHSHVSIQSVMSPTQTIVDQRLIDWVLSSVVEVEHATDDPVGT